MYNIPTKQIIYFVLHRFIFLRNILILNIKFNGSECKVDVPKNDKLK